MESPTDVFVRALNDDNAAVRHAAIVALFDRGGPLPEQVAQGPARSEDTYLRQAAAFLLCERATFVQLERMIRSTDATERLAGVLAAGFRLTVPPVIGALPAELPLRYESGNAKFVIDYADATVDLKQLGPIGSFTIAERWKQLTPTSEQQKLFSLLLEKLDDANDGVALQAGYFLSLLARRAGRAAGGAVTANDSASPLDQRGATAGSPGVGDRPDGRSRRLHHRALRLNKVRSIWRHRSSRAIRGSPGKPPI